MSATRLKPMEELLAYKDKCTSESMRKHVNTMYELYVELYRDRGWTSIVARRIGLSEDTLDTAVRHLIAFHDAGKVFYQNRIRDGRGAPLHEVYSVLIFHSYAERTDGIFDRVSESLLMAIEWSILTHHLPMRSPRDIMQLINALDSENLLSYIPKTASLDFELKRRLEYALEDVIGKVNIPSGRYSLGDILGIYRGLRGALHKYYSVAVRLLRVLIVTDNMAASINRSTKCNDEDRKRFKAYISDIPGPEYDHARGELQSWLNMFY